MFLKKSFNKKTGRTYLDIVHGYRDNKGVSRFKTVKSLGYLDELEEEYDDPISHFANEAKNMDEQRLIDRIKQNYGASGYIKKTIIYLIIMMLF